MSIFSVYASLGVEAHELLTPPMLIHSGEVFVSGRRGSFEVQRYRVHLFVVALGRKCGPDLDSVDLFGS